MLIRANCKINIGLDVLRRREDGYHELSTLMFPVRRLYDTIEIEPMPGDEVRLVERGIATDCAPADNLCVRAAESMRLRYGLGGVRITLDKRVPFGAGLGGGSSDATAVIVALDRLFGLRLPEAELIDRAAALGSDTAFFVRNTPQLCSGRGEVMHPCPLDLRGWWLVVLKPDVNVSTRTAYAGVRPAIPEVPLATLLELPPGQWQGRVKNDFEPSVFAAFPRLESLKRRLQECGAVYASMSGSGSALFGLFDEMPDMSDLPAEVFRHVERL